MSSDWGLPRKGVADFMTLSWILCALRSRQDPIILELRIEERFEDLIILPFIIILENNEDEFSE